MSKHTLKSDSVVKAPEKTHKFVCLQQVAMEDDRHLWQIVEGRMTSDNKVTESRVVYTPDELRYTVEKYMIGIKRLLMNGGIRDLT